MQHGDTNSDTTYRITTQITTAQDGGPSSTALPGTQRASVMTLTRGPSASSQHTSAADSAAGFTGSATPLSKNSCCQPSQCWQECWE